MLMPSTHRHAILVEEDGGVCWPQLLLGIIIVNAHTQDWGVWRRWDAKEVHADVHHQVCGYLHSGTCRPSAGGINQCCIQLANYRMQARKESLNQSSAARAASSKHNVKGTTSTWGHAHLQGYCKVVRTWSRQP